MSKDQVLSVGDFAGKYLAHLRHCIDALDMSALDRIAGALFEARDSGSAVFIAGNGGSAATASHMANDLAKTVLGHNRVEPGAFRAFALTDNVPLVTAWANDNHFDQVFSGQLVMLARPGDVLVLISGSGSSGNILRAADTAHEIGMSVIALLGKGGGAMLEKADIALVVASDESGIVEDMHMILDHLLTNYFVTLAR